MNDDRMIRFITSDYKDLFQLPDGGSIVVTHENGEQYVGICKFLDETHTEINGNCYHICQFAEMLERNGSKAEPEKEPEMVGSYRVTHRIPVNDKIYVFGHNPKAAQPYGTWQAYRDVPGKDWGHYWTNKSDAWSDLLLRADAERTGKHYDHTKRYKQKNRDDAR